MASRVTVVGGGIGGLVAGIELAERGWKVELHERSARLGGLAQTLDRPYRANVGPHAFYTNNCLFDWLERRRILPPLSRPGGRDLLEFRILDQGRSRRFLSVAPGATRRLRADPPADSSYRDWASRAHGERWAERLIGLASLPLFHPDPGRLSAATVHAGLRAAYVDGRVRYVLGGFGALVGLLARRAREVGVVIITESPVDALPPTPCVLAVDLGAARRLTGDDSLGWPAEPVGLLDLVVNESRSDAVASLDLDDHVWANQYSRYDRTLTPDGTVLVQAHAGLRNGESMQGAVARIERMLDRHFEGWRERVHWRRDHIRRDGATPADPPGTTWRDRPSPSRGDGLWVVNDRVARPGLLSSVSVSAALSAVADLCADPTAAAADASGEWR